MKYRQVVAYKTYFDEFFKNQNDKVQKKIIKAVSYTHLTLPTTPYV